MSLEHNLREMERTRESYWLRYPTTSPIRLRWRAHCVRHSFHVWPGQSILELGAGSGLWTEYLTNVLKGQNPITAAVFNPDLAEGASAKDLPNVTVRSVEDLSADLPSDFDYVVGTAILCHDRFADNLKAIRSLLRPGGQLLFFEANFWNPQVLLKSAIPPLGKWAGNAGCQIGMRKYELMRIASRQGFTEIEIVPYDILHPRTPPSMIPTVRSLAFVLEHAPAVREVCGTLYIWARKPGTDDKPRATTNLATEPALFDSTSVVVPCHNEAMNIPNLIRDLLQTYDRYLREIIIVDDNSSDGTAEVAAAIARSEPKVRVVRRNPPSGVGRALRDGYASATGRYILSMDCDFIHLVPEFNDLFQAIAAGHDGAIGSRFSHQSVVLNYPFSKLIGNRAFHLLVRLFLRKRVRDVTNNLKLYRASILKDLVLEQSDFAVNAETGLKPLLDGYDIVEVPISWINRTSEMGRSSFKLVTVSPSYFRTLMRLLRNSETRARS